MIMICNVPDEVVKNVKMGTWCGSSIAEKMIANGIPLDKIRAEIEPKCDRINSLASVLPYTAHREIQELLCEIMDLYKAESEDAEAHPINITKGFEEFTKMMFRQGQEKREVEDGKEH